MRKAILDLFRMQYPFEETLPESLMRGLNPIHFDDIDADAENHCRSDAVAAQEFQHFRNRLAQADRDGAADDAVADV